ncbi:MAG TPA: hypothetical protein VLA54_12645 [Acidimicrobiia bacterium]|nr:hypothetical protein [Acidimicrobiia bacterium]
MTLRHLRRCAWCGAGFKAGGGPGRPASFCRRSHRQRAYEARTLAARHGLGPDDALMSRRLLTELQDGLYLLQSAMEDVDNDLAEAGDAQGLRAALWHLYGAAAGLRMVRIEPKAVGPGPVP